MPAIKKRMIKPHIKNCGALERCKSGQWSTPWYATGKILYRGAGGANWGSGYSWLEFACNDSECKARMIVSVQDVLFVIEEGSL